MRLFGKRSNSRPEMSDVPPELRPYYREQAVAIHARRTALRLVLILMVLVLIGAGGLRFWLNHTKTKKNPASSSPPTSSQQALNDGTNGTPPTSGTTNTDTPPPQSTPSPSTTPAPSTTSPQSQPSSSAPSTTTPTTSASTMPNTGPGSTAVLIVVAIGAVATAGYHLYQRRTVTDY